MAISEHIQRLFVKYLNNTASNEEYQELLAYFRIDSESENAAQLLYDAIATEHATQEISEERLDKITNAAYQRLDERIHPHKKRTAIWKWLPYAAAAIIVIGGYWIYQQYTHTETPPALGMVSEFGDDLPPGTNRATIILPDGKQIPLSEQKEGLRAGTDGLAYTDGQLIQGTAEAKYVTIKTPNGGQYQLILPDGTRVWLNAASSFSYPTTFAGSSREVNLQGEAYLEVAHDASKPFILKSERQTIEVLGTAFNVNAYTDQSASATTLVEGSIRLKDRNTGDQSILKPGQQAISASLGLSVQTVNTAQFTGWKDGLFVLNDADFATIKRQLERWYDVTFVGQPANDATVSAILSRNVNLSDVLKAMENYTGAKFRIDGRRIMVQ